VKAVDVSNIALEDNSLGEQRDGLEAVMMVAPRKLKKDALFYKA
jgi:hypothetical protein